MRVERAFVTLAICASCAGAHAFPSFEKLAGTDNALHEVAPQGSDKYTVLIFFSADCHVLKLHDERLRRLATHYGERGVRFYGVDPEVGATLDRDRAEAERRGYPFPILLDAGARLARMFGAEYAGHAVVLDRHAEVVYRGGIDSDRIHLTEGTNPYLSDAVADLLAGKAPRIAESKTLGCALRTW